MACNFRIVDRDQMYLAGADWPASRNAKERTVRRMVGEACRA